MAIWHTGTLLKKEMVAANVMSLTFSLADWVMHRPGQHYDIRLTAPSGYMAERSYSAASTPEDTGVVEYGVQILENGEVSPYLFQLKEGQQVEMRGPIGGHFVWDTTMPGPLVLIGGGSGMVPLMAMLRHHINHLEKDTGRKIIFIVSARSLDLVLYKDELKKIQEKDSNVNVVITLTDNPPSDWTGYKRRVDKEMLIDVLGNIKDEMPMTYICGPTPFVEVVAGHMIGLGFTAHSIKTERFGG